jgi:hypothetical protein
MLNVPQIEALRPTNPQLYEALKRVANAALGPNQGWNLDEQVTDGVQYARVSTGATTAGKIDPTKTGVLMKGSVARLCVGNSLCVNGFGAGCCAAPFARSRLGLRRNRAGIGVGPARHALRAGISIALRSAAAAASVGRNCAFDFLGIDAGDGASGARTRIHWQVSECAV